MRRTWMLLLVTVLLTVFLAVPAMAADCEDCSGANHCCDCVTGTTDAERHPASEGWQDLNAVLTAYEEETGLTVKDGYIYYASNANLFEANGKYYLSDDLNYCFMFDAEGLNITICLNSHTWSGTRKADGDAANARNFGVNKKGSTINVLDCSAQDENGVSAGIIQGGSSNMGGAIYASNGAVVNFYNGTITGGISVGTTAGSHGGGNIFLTSANTAFNMYGGRVENGSTASMPGGNVYVNSGADFFMRGGTITGGDSATSTNSSGGGNVYITGSGSLFEMHAGTISDGSLTNQKCGANVLVTSSGRFDMYDGLITGGGEASTSTETRGGNVFVSESAVFNMYDGTIENGKAYYGGNVALRNANATFNMYGGDIQDGEARYGGNATQAASTNKFNLYAGTVSGGLATGSKAAGGNFYIYGGTLTLGDPEKTEAKEGNDTVKVLDGQAYYTTTASVNGGNINAVNGTTVKMYYGTVSGGLAANTSGNIRADGTMYMYGGVVEGGLIGQVRDTASATDGSSNMQLANANAKLIMSGGWIHGYVTIYKDGHAEDGVQLSGSAKIYAEDSDGDGLADSGLYAQALPVIAGELNSDAKIALVSYIDGTEQTTLVYHADSYSGIDKDWAGYIQNRQLVGYGSKWLTWQAGDADGDGEIAAGEGIATYEAEDNTNKTRWHCVCGYNPFEEGGHIGDCDTYDYGWNRITDGTKLNTSGKYYLDLSGVDPEGTDKDGNPVYTISWASLSGTDATVIKQVYLDMNGYTLEQPTVGDRFLTFYSTTRTTPYDVVITDSSIGHTGRIGAYGTFIEARTLNSVASPQGRLFWMARTVTRPDGQSFGDRLSIYRITLDASSCEAGMSTTSNGTTTKESWRGLVATVTNNSRANFYNCDMVGGSTSNTSVSNSKPANGIVIRLENANCSVNIVGGTIQSGSAVTGGGIGLTNGTLNIDGTTIYGGVATQTGGAIHALGGTIDIRNATIIGGQANTSGGAIYVNGSVDLDITNSCITNKTGEKNPDGTDVTVPMSSGASGGAIYSNGCALTIENTTIEGATAGTNGGLILQLYGSLELKGCTLNGGVANYASSGGGGAIYAEDTTVTIDKYVKADGEVVTTRITDCEAVKFGGSMYINRTTVNLKHGIISNGTCTSATGGGGNIYLTGNTTTAGVFNMGVENATVTDALNETVVVSGGETSGSNTHGGNFRILANGRLNMYYGTIKEGKANNQGANLRMDGTFNMYNGVVKDGYTKGKTTYTEYKLNGNANANMMMTYGAKFNMYGGHIHGYVASFTDSTNMPAITLEKAAKIYHPTISSAGLTIEYAAEYKDAEGNLINDGNQILTIRDLTAAAKLVFIHSNPKDGNLLTTTPIDENCVLTGLYYGNNDYKLGLNTDGNLYMMSAANATTGAVINDGDLVLTLPQAVAMASGNDFVRLLSAHEGTLEVAKDLNLDLAGNTITGGISVTGGQLQLIDSANYAYTDEGNRVTITTSGEGSVARAFITGTMTNYGANHRYLVLKHQDGTYSAHRIYLAVQNPVLFPAKAAISFRTMLVCDDTVAGYINNGGAYGVAVTGTAGTDAVPYDTQVLAFGTEQNQNSKVAGVVNILTGGDDDETRANENLKAYAYIHVNDAFGDNEITSSEKSANLKQVVQNADKATDLTNTQKVAMALMYTRNPVMQNWDLPNIRDYAVQAGVIERHCLCGDTTRTNTPCAAKGHPQADWQELPENYYNSETTVQWAEGNYYLTGDITLKNQPDIPAGAMVCLDTKGFDITTMDDGRVANVYGVFNLTNSVKDDASIITVNSKPEGNGGLLIYTGGNVSLYDGVTLQAAENHQIRYGVIASNGSLNIYGGTIVGTTLYTEGEAQDNDGFGGAVYNGDGSYMFMNNGTIIGGNGNAKGGAIYQGGGECHIKGDAVITGGNVTSGGLIYMAAGEVNISGVTLDASDLTADYGTAICVAGGTLNLNGNPQADGDNITYDTVIKGGTAYRGGALHVAGENATVNINGAKISGGTANGYETTTTDSEGVETVKYNASRGGAVNVESKGELKLTNKAMIEGGHADGGGNLYVASSGTKVSVTDSFIRNGQALRDTENHRNGSGANISIVGGSLSLTNTTVEGGTVSAFDNNSDESKDQPGDMYGGSVLYAGGGTTTVTNSKLYGYREAKLWKHGGTIMNRGGTIELTDSTIVTGSWVETDASVLYNSGTFTMTDSILDASLLRDTDDTSITYAGAVRNSKNFTMKGERSEIRGYKISYTNGGGALYSSGGTVIMEGGTIYCGTASSTGVGGNVAIKGGSFTMSGGTIQGGTFEVNDTEITGGVATGSSTKGGNLYVSGKDTEVTLSGGTIEGGTVANGALGGNLYVASGTVNISGAVIGSETVPETVDAVTGGNVYIAGGTLNLSGTGTIRNGIASEKGGNLYMEAGTFNMTGGTISNTAILEDTDANYLYGGTHATLGGNIYMADGTLTMSGGTITGGVAKHGGNVYVAAGDAEFSGGTIKDGFAVKLNNSSEGQAGNLYTLGNTTLSGVEIRDGKATHTNGNVYSNGGTLTMTGGLITGGVEHNGKEFISNSATNVFVVSYNFTMTGGTIDGGVTINNYGRDWETEKDKCYMVIGGSAEINNNSGYGLSLKHGTKSAAVTDPETGAVTTPAVYFKSPIFDAEELLNLDSEKASIVIQNSDDELLVKRPVDENGAFTMDEAAWLALCAKAEAVITTTASGKQITVEEDGIYLRSLAKNTRYGCECGANSGEAHVNGCVGYDILWNKWNASTLPNVPGYWYLEYTDAVVEPSSTYLNRDFLQAADGSFVCKEGSTTPLALASVVDADGNPTGELKWHDGETWLTYEKADTDTLVASYDVHVDLNGHKIDGPDGGRVYSYLNSISAASSKRQAAANLTVIDSSVGHTGGMSTAGVYGTKDSFSTSSQPQGSLIWMPYETDSLTTCFVELNASSATHGRGNALDTHGTVHFWNTKIVGGTATDYTKNEELMANAVGGGAIHVNSTANVTMHGGSITGGKAVFEWIRQDYGVMLTSCYGGANVFVNGGTFTMDGGIISGGETWVENGSSVNDLIRSMPGVGAGVYVHNDGQFHAKGDAKVQDNIYYTYTVNDNGTADDYTDDTYVCTKETTASSNVYIGGGAIYDDGLTEGAHIGIHMDVYEGVFAYTSNENSKNYIFRDDTDTAVSEAIFDSAGGTLAFGDGVYQVGYGMASIQPSNEDLVTGLTLNGYGNANRTTNKLYDTSYDVLNSAKLSMLEDFSDHSDMAATAVAITDAQGETVLLINVDMTSAGSSVGELARQMVSLKTGVPEDHITISASHQHSSPSVNTLYYTNAEGAYTQADKTTLLQPSEDRVIKTDYARTFYHGVVDAAVAAMGDRKEATVSAGILDTTNRGTVQYNYVRNKTVTVLNDYTHYVGGDTTKKIEYKATQTYNVTDNHYGIEKKLYENICKALAGETVDDGYDAAELIRCFDIQYESVLDTTMQLVKFDRGEGNTPIVLANFQTHPHKGGSKNSYFVHSDVVGAFRYYLKEKSGANVIYFSGAGGNVNTTGTLADKTKSTDYDEYDFTLVQSEYSVYTQMAKVAHYGDTLAALANTFLSAGMTEVTGTKNVSVMTKTVEFNYQSSYLRTLSEEDRQGVISRISTFYNWEEGGYLDGYDPSSFQDNQWWEMVGQFGYDQANLKIYSAYHANKLHTRYTMEERNTPTGEIDISAYNLGGIGFVAAPYEMFQESGQAIKGNVPNSTYVPESGATNQFAYTIVATQANDSRGYIAARIGYQNGGGYSSTDNSIFAEGTAETLVNEFVGMLNGLYE